ncbi:ImmA/IrrE family metallo-endopeptidase [Lentzea sp. NPDC058450]|uniref:ImmA/IrrE family metallo-endopeptidase n=1 Tax=Lentzea sp. NPDC058450 TaxID=3346505 RepID=UPI00365ECD9A
MAEQAGAERRGDFESSRGFPDELEADGEIEAARWYRETLAGLPDPVRTIEDHYEALKDSVVEAVVRVGHDPERVRSVVLVPQSRATVSASAESYPDGSALVLISNAVLGLAEVYGQHLARAVMKPNLRTFLKKGARFLRTGRVEFDTELLTAVLRHNSRVQRSFNLAQTFMIGMEPVQLRLAELLSRHAMRFVIAHEVAHHVLGHAGRSHLAPVDGVASCTGEQQAELEADRLAYQVVLAAQQHDGVGLPSQVPLGALVAIAVLHYAESSLFLRTGVSHPPVDRRLGVLWQEVPFHVRPTFNSYALPLFEATDRAADFVQGSRPDVDWALLRTRPEVQHHPFSLMAHDVFVRCDELQALAPDQLAEQLGPWPALHEGAEALLDGRPGDAARLWELSPTWFDTWKTQAPLAAYTVRGRLQRVPALQDLTPLLRCPVAEAMAGLVEHTIIRS